MRLSRNQLLALATLVKSSRGLDAFSLFRRLNLSFSEFTKSTLHLSELDFITEPKEDFFQVTPSGKEYWAKQQTQRSKKTWREIPEQFLGTKVKTNSFYIPSITKLDKSTFKIKKTNIE